MSLVTKTSTPTARGLALMLLGEIFDKGAYSNIALKKGLQNQALSAADKALVTELVYGTVARKLTLAWYLSHYIADRDQLDSWVYQLLMLSLYQLLYLDKIPQHAVVHEAVQLAKRQLGADKFVNAILRKFLSTPLPEISAIKRQNKRWSIQYSLPVWLVKKLVETYGQDRALKIFESLLVRNKASVRVVDLADKADLMRETESQASLLAETALVKAHGHFAATPAFQAGRLTIQDESSQLVAPTLQLAGHERVLDACAAPGGKTTHIASYLTTGQVTALDLYDHKLALIRDNAARLGVADKVITQKLDATQVHQQYGPDSFDKILVDAPCSGIGLIRRKPDIKYNKGTADFGQLQAIQLKILDSVCQTVVKNGIITYSTCTIVPEENFQVLAQFLASHPNFEQVPLTHRDPHLVQDGCLLITPEQHLTDGFFICQVRRKS